MRQTLYSQSGILYRMVRNKAVRNYLGKFLLDIHSTGSWLPHRYKSLVRIGCIQSGLSCLCKTLGGKDYSRAVLFQTGSNLQSSPCIQVNLH